MEPGKHDRGRVVEIDQGHDQDDGAIVRTIQGIAGTFSLKWEGFDESSHFLTGCAAASHSARKCAASWSPS